VEPWYVFPDGQLRPTVINLWGMTSTGKTSLIIRLFDLLEMNSVLKFDTGEWVDKSDFQLTNKISNQVRQIKKDNTIPIFIFDEFQLGRTLDDMGGDIDRPQLRVIWDLFDTGKFSILEERWEVKSLIKIYAKLEYLLKDKKVVVKNGKVIKNKEAWDLIFSEDSEDEIPNLDQQNKKNEEELFIPPYAIYNIKELSDNTFYSEAQLIEYLKTLDGDETLQFLEKIIELSIMPCEYNFSNSIIFVIGNLDDAYTDACNMNPDMDADTLYEHTSEIILSDIKNSLTFLYRPEQISRLGNNHIIYKSFNEQMYKDIITMEIVKIQNKIKDKFEIDITFDDSIHSLIYNEGVFPTQGVRPIFSTVSSLIESYIVRIIVDALKSKININIIDWKFVKNEYHICLNKSKKILKYPVQLKVDNIRQTKSDDIQALVGIHEAGHVITSIYALNLCPKMVVSRPASNNGGFTTVDLPDYATKKLLMNDIICCIGGYVAEKMIFGEDNLTNGSYSDLERTTSTALKIVKEYGMIGTPLQFSTPDFRVSSHSICLNDDNLDKEAVNIVYTCMETATNILTDNMELLLKLGEHLTNNSKMNSDEIKEFVKKYGKTIPSYKTKETYYDFKTILENKLKND